MEVETNGPHLVGDIFKFIFIYEAYYILMKLWSKFIPKGPN